MAVSGNLGWEQKWEKIILVFMLLLIQNTGARKTRRLLHSGGLGQNCKTQSTACVYIAKCNAINTENSRLILISQSLKQDQLTALKLTVIVRSHRP